MIKLYGLSNLSYYNSKRTLQSFNYIGQTKEEVIELYNSSESESNEDIIKNHPSFLNNYFFKINNDKVSISYCLFEFEASVKTFVDYINYTIGAIDKADIYVNVLNVSLIFI